MRPVVRTMPLRASAVPLFHALWMGDWFSLTCGKKDAPVVPARSGTSDCTPGTGGFFGTATAPSCGWTCGWGAGTCTTSGVCPVPMPGRFCGTPMRPISLRLLTRYLRAASSSISSHALESAAICWGLTLYEKMLMRMVLLLYASSQPLLSNR